MSDEDAAKLANRFELPGMTEAFWGPEDRPEWGPPPMSVREPERLTFFGLWRHALGFGRDR